MLNSVIALKSFVWLNLAAFAVLVFVYFRNRGFCRYLCPVGWGCDMVSKLSCRKTSSYKHFPDAGKWLAIISLIPAAFGLPLFILLDPMAIFSGFMSVFSGAVKWSVIISLAGLPLLLAVHLLLPGIWCRKICPLGGLQKIIMESKISFRHYILKKKLKTGKTDQGRRLFLASGIGILAGLSLPGMIQSGTSEQIRPPASAHPDLFNLLCVRCGNCIRACPTKILEHFTGSGNLLAWMTPEVSFEEGYCLETCNLCSRVCPSGAITLFSVEAKREIFMGIAEIHIDDCLLSKNTECDRCKSACKYDALDIVKGEYALLMQPEIIPDKCVGCGACAVICPESAIEMKPV